MVLVPVNQTVSWSLETAYMVEGPRSSHSVDELWIHVLHLGVFIAQVFDFLEFSYVMIRSVNWEEDV